MIALLLLVILVTTALVKYFQHMNRMEKYVKHLNIKGPVYPFIGNALHMVGKSPVELFNEVMKIIREMDTPHKAYVGPMLFVVLDRPEDIKIVLTSTHCLEKPFFNDFLPIRNGILNARSLAVWKPGRKLLSPAFNSHVLQSFMPAFNDETRVLTRNIAAKAGEPDFDIYPFMNFCTLKTTCATTMGIDSMSSNDIRKFLLSLGYILEALITRFVKLWTQPDFIYRHTTMYKIEKQHYDVMNGFTNRVFEIKKSEYIAKRKNASVGETGPRAAIDYMLESYLSGRCNETAVKDQILTLLMAGSDTTAVTMSFAILMLAMHPKIQEKLFNELRSSYSSQDEDTTFNQLKRLPYLNCCLKETMRLFPVAGLLTRTANDNIQVSTCVIPKGSTIALPILSMHRRKDLWGDEPDQFNPDHFLPENVRKRHPFAFLPFGGGPRHCIGHEQSMVVMKVMLSACVRNFQFSTRLKMSQMEFKYNVLLRLVNKHMITVNKRNW